MNIIVVRPDGSWYSRPDTTLEREAKDFYLPDSFSEVSVCDSFFVRIVKAGKAIGAKFVERYVNTFAEAKLLYGEPGGSPYIDASTVVVSGEKPISELEPELFERVVSSLCEITRITSIRIGDLVFFETSEPYRMEKGASTGIISIR